MNKIKIVLLGTIVLLLTGCDVEYNLEINREQIKESSNFIYPNTEKNTQVIDSYYKNNYLAYYNMDLRKDYNYIKNQIKDDKKVGMTLYYSYNNSSSYQKSSLLDYCYYKKSIVRTKDYLLITTDGKTRCFYKDATKNIDNLTINIKTELKVLEHNADQVKDNVYTWAVNDKNYQNKPINIKIDVREEKESDVSFWTIVLIVLSSLLLIALILFTFVRIKGHRNNKL